MYLQEYWGWLIPVVTEAELDRIAFTGVIGADIYVTDKGKLAERLGEDRIAWFVADNLWEDLEDFLQDEV